VSLPVFRIYCKDISDWPQRVYLGFVPTWLLLGANPKQWPRGPQGDRELKTSCRNMYVPLEDTIRVSHELHGIVQFSTTTTTLMETRPISVFTGANRPTCRLIISSYCGESWPDLLIPNMVLICSSSTPRLWANCMRIMVLSAGSALLYEVETPADLPVHLCAASFATLTASFFRSYRTGSAAPKAANSDFNASEVVFSSCSDSSSFRLSGYNLKSVLWNGERGN
jgi:hypothetical protein